MRLIDSISKRVLCVFSGACIELMKQMSGSGFECIQIGRYKPVRNSSKRVGFFVSRNDSEGYAVGQAFLDTTNAVMHVVSPHGISIISKSHDSLQKKLLACCYVSDSSLDIDMIHAIAKPFISRHLLKPPYFLESELNRYIDMVFQKSLKKHCDQKLIDRIKSSVVCAALKRQSALKTPKLRSLRKNGSLTTNDEVECAAINAMSCGEKTIIYNSSSKGAGKTELNARIFAAANKINGLPFVIVPRRSLALQQSVELGAESYLTPQHKADYSNGLVTTIHSLLKFSSLQSETELHSLGDQCKVLIIDEFTQVMRSLASSLINGFRRKKICDSLVALYRNCDLIMFSDDDLRQMPESIDLFFDLVGGNRSECNVIHGETLIERSNYNVDLVSSKTLFDTFCQWCSDEERILFVSDSKREGQLLYEKALEHYPSDRVVFFHGDDKTSAEMQAARSFFYKPELVKKQYDVVIFSPCITSGLSIADPWFTRHGGFFSGRSVLYSDFMQMLHRDRTARSFLVGVECEVTPKQIKNLRNTSVAVAQAGSSRDSAIARIRHYEASCSVNSESLLIRQFVDEGYAVTDSRESITDQDIEFRLYRNQFGRQHKMKRIHHCLAAPIISREDLRDLALKDEFGEITIKERALLDRALVSHYFGDNFSESDAYDVIFGSLAAQIANLMRTLKIKDDAARKDKFEAINYLQVDRTKQSALKSVGVKILAFSKEAWDKFKAYDLLLDLAPYADVINSSLSPSFFFDPDRLCYANANEWYGRLLLAFGLKTKCVSRKLGDGCRIRQYAVDLVSHCRIVFVIDNIVGQQTMDNVAMDIILNISCSSRVESDQDQSSSCLLAA